MTNFFQWLDDQGYSYHHVDRMPDSLFGIGCGVNGVDVPHVVAWKGKGLWHDPNPNGNGFKLEFVDYFIQLIDFYR